MKKVSIKDIALKVGVSNASVSMVLNGNVKKGRISKEMIEKIQTAAKTMNYQPNRLARSLQSGRTQTIGLLVADISNPFFGALAFHIQEQIEEAGYAVIIMNTNESDTKMGKMIELLKERQVDGFIIVPTEYGERYIAPLAETNIPLVLMDRYYPSIPTTNVLVDNYQASLEATNLLITHGCKRIALLVYHNNQPHMLERKRGYTDALKKAGLLNESLIKEVNYTNIAEDIRQAITNLRQNTGESAVDGILFATNSIAVIGIKQLLNLNIRIPEEIQVASFDKSEAFDLMTTPIPYIQQPIFEIAKKSVQVLIEQIEKETSQPCIHKLPGRLVTVN